MDKDKIEQHELDGTTKGLVSIIAIFYEVEKYIHQCIDSILKQSYSNLEIILVDDGSLDSSGKICDEYAKVDSRIKVIHKENGGADSARKAGIQKATGEYIGYIDGDDWIESQMFEKLVYYMQTYHVDTVESGIFDSTENCEMKRLPSFVEGEYKGDEFEQKIEPYILYTGEFYRLGIMASLCNKLYKREFITRYQMMPEPSDNIVDDTFCAIPCVAETKSLYITHECFYHYRIRTDSVKRKVRDDFAEKILSCYPQWLERFPYVADKSNIKIQIQYYLMYLLLSKAMYIFDDVLKNEILIPYGGISKHKKIIIYGAGAVGVQLQNYVFNEMGDNLVLWVDKNYKDLKNTLPVSDPKLIINTEYDVIIIAILWSEKAKSAKSDLVKMGIPESKILWIKPEYIEEPKCLLEKVKDYWDL